MPGSSWVCLEKRKVTKGKGYEQNKSRLNRILKLTLLFTLLFTLGTDTLLNLNQTRFSALSVVGERSIHDGSLHVCVLLQLQHWDSSSEVPHVHSALLEKTQSGSTTRITHQH